MALIPHMSHSISKVKPIVKHVRAKISNSHSTERPAVESWVADAGSARAAPGWMTTTWGRQELNWICHVDFQFFDFYILFLEF